MQVKRCKYVAAEGDDVKKIGDMFEVDWLTLWGINTHLKSLATPPGSEVRLPLA